MLDTRRSPIRFLITLAALGLSGCHHAARSAGSPDVTVVKGVGFVQPENLVYDSVADVYLVANMGGGGPSRDGNGFVSRVGPAGRVLALKWIASGARGARLDAPKGLALRGDTLAVADIGRVRYFDRRSGEPLGEVALPGRIMNDVAWSSDGSLWITDTGPERTPPMDTTSDMDAIWHVTRGAVDTVARGLALDRPDGLVIDGGDALVATFGAARIERVPVNAHRAASGTTFAAMPAGRVDGLRALANGDLLVTSWDAGTVWRRTRGGALRPLLTDVKSPAGVAVDTRRGRLAITSMQDNALYLLPLR